MCRFCEGDNMVNDAICKHDDVSIAYSKKGAYILVVGGCDGEFETWTDRINYCPMCGSELNES